VKAESFKKGREKVFTNVDTKCKKAHLDETSEHLRYVISDKIYSRDTKVVYLHGWYQRRLKVLREEIIEQVSAFKCFGCKTSTNGMNVDLEENFEDYDRSIIFLWKAVISWPLSVFHCCYRCIGLWLEHSRDVNIVCGMRAWNWQKHQLVLAVIQVWWIW
jgi:hypothetical protein